VRSIPCGLAALALFPAVTVACRGPCTPSPACESPGVPLANAEAGEELGGRAHWYAQVDTAGSNLAQPISAPFMAGGANHTQRAARISGTLASSVDAFAVLGLKLDRDWPAHGRLRTLGQKWRRFSHEDPIHGHLLEHRFVLDRSSRGRRVETIRSPVHGAEAVAREPLVAPRSDPDPAHGVVVDRAWG